MTRSPLPAAIREAVSRWDADRRDDWEERAAIIEFMAGEDRDTAERKAFYELRRTKR